MKRLCFFWNPLTAIILALYVCIPGCVQQHRSLNGTIRMEVDDEEYWVTRYANVDRRGSVATSSLVVRPVFGHPAGGSEHYNSQRGTTIFTITNSGTRVIAETDTVYFVREGRIEIERKYYEIGIDSSRLNAELGDMRIYLQPILEKVIRENGDLQTPKIEEK